jgi:hypothetical protein
MHQASTTRVMAMLEPIAFIALIVLLVWASQGDA